MPTPRPAALHQQITAAWELVQEARMLGNPKKIETAEQRLDRLIDRLPRKALV